MGRKAQTPPSPFWERLSIAWARQGLPTSQNGVATRLGDMSQGSTRRWYLGEGYPEVPTLLEIARLGKCSTHWLLTGEGPESVHLDPDTAALLRHWHLLTPTAKMAVLRTARMEHAVQFTGDPEARAAFEQSLEDRTTALRGHGHAKPK